MKQLNFRDYWILCFGFLFILQFSSFGFSQKQESKTAEELRVWQQRTDGLTESIVKDFTFAEDGERAIYYALLATVTATSTPLEAKRYSKRAFDLTLKSIDSFDDKNLINNINQAEKVIQLITAVDEPLGLTLAEKIAKILNAKEHNGKSSADSFVTIALQVVEKNPRLAFDLGLRSLAYGNSLRLNVLISRLNAIDSQLGEVLFKAALASNKRSYNYEFTSGLGIIVFDNREGKVFSDSARKSYLEMLAEMISRGAMVETERAVGCEVAPLTTPILTMFDSYMPDRALTVRQQIQYCISFSHQFTAEIAKAESGSDQPQTADDFVHAARQANDPGLKGHYFFKAVSILASSKKYDTILSLLDDMTDDERQAIGSVAWDSWRTEYAFLSVLDYFDQKDMASVYRIIEHTPKKNRPYVRFRLAYKLAPNGNRDFILENLEQIRKEIATLDILPKDAASNFLSLARLYAKIQPTESESIFGSAVKYINKTDSENDPFQPEKDYAPLQDYVRLPYELIENDESSILSSITSVGSRHSRIRLKLGLLESSLQRLEKVKKDFESEKRISSKTMPN